MVGGEVADAVARNLTMGPVGLTALASLVAASLEMYVVFSYVAAAFILALYPFPENFPVGAVSMLVAVLVFVAVSLATQDRHEVPADLRALLER